LEATNKRFDFCPKQGYSRDSWGLAFHLQTFLEKEEICTSYFHLVIFSPYTISGHQRHNLHGDLKMNQKRFLIQRTVRLQMTRDNFISTVTEKATKTRKNTLSASA